jgi:hypothetical protein
MRIACLSHRLRNGRLAVLFLFAAWLAWAPSAARADLSYSVAGDLSALPAATSIILDFQFNPGVGTYDSATATVSSFTSTNLVLGAATPSGGGSGSLPGGITLVNSTGFNEVFQAATVGANATFHFTLDLSGPAISAPSPGATAGTSFGLGVLDSSFNPFAAYGSNDPVLRIDINAGSPVPVVSTVITPPIQIQGTTTMVPEPSGLTIVVMVMSIVGGGLVLRRRRTEAVP